MNLSKLAQAFRAFAESFALLAEALEEEALGLQASEADAEPASKSPEVEEAHWEEEPKKVAEKPAAGRPVSKKVWEEELPTEEGLEVIELKDLQEAGRQVIKLHGAPALAKILKAHGLKNLSSADPEDYPTIYAELKELIND